MSKNKYGLSRDIPAPIKREVRQRCGFGCVKCGMSVYEYEHLDPEFSEAKKHDPNGIVLLCGGCHSLKTRRMLSVETIKKHAENPFCKREGMSSAWFDISDTHPEITLGNLSCIDIKSLINIDGESIFSIEPPEEPGSPFRINAFLVNKKGEEILRIDNNEWKTPTTNWDVDVVGPRITIRNGLRDIALILRVEAPKSLIVERLEMLHRGVSIKCQEGHDLEIITQDGAKLTSGGASLIGCSIGIDLSRAGMSIGVGCRSAHIHRLNISHQPTARNQGQGKLSTYEFVDRYSGRNDKCPCGSSMQYKKCCGKLGSS